MAMIRQKPNNKENEELHSESVNDVLGTTPVWLLRWGITLLLFLAALILAVCSTISYPDQIKAQMTVLMNSPSHRILSMGDYKTFLYGKLAISQKDIPKIKKGQLVLIRLHRYPFEEYGILKGKLILVSDSTEENGDVVCRASIDFHGRTDIGKSIDLKPGMLADAEIITTESTILKRLFGRVFKR